MSMTRLAFLNFKQSFRNHLALIVSQAFTVLVLFNFQVILSSDAFVVLGTRNKAYIDMLVQMVSFVLGCFMFFFIWYSTDVFLTSRKKAIGLYVFMGLSNEKIGQMYLIQIHTRNLLIPHLYNPPRNSHHCTVGRHFFKHHAPGADLGILPNSKRT